jgi:3',5'-cyclic AMP phosphodiesterase CpdA
MRLRILSDLHLEFDDWVPPAVDADVVIIAGDLHKQSRGIPWLIRHFGGTPVIYVAGNHEFYGAKLPDELGKLKTAAASQPGLHFLENESVLIGEVTFLGCTLWTDFNLHGDPALAGRTAAGSMNDYRQIRVTPGFRRLRGHDTARFHARSRSWLEQEFARLRATRFVVITHHAPSPLSLEPAFANDPLSPAYASRLDDLVATSGAMLWVHGHTHHSVDYRIGATRVLANQKGYPHQADTGFVSDFVVSI